MSSIDQRVVEMKLDNKQFESGVASTMSALDKLKAALSFSGASKGLTDLNAAGGRVNLSHIGAAVDSIKEKFSALSVAGIAALGALATRATQFGINQVKNMIQPITAGFAEYELKMNSIQTIMANTAKRGTSLEEVTAVLDELNEYADLTIYNFGQMTTAIGQLTATGMGVDEAATSVKGFANWAAAAGVQSGDMAGAMVQLNQGLQTGTIRLQDWMSLEKRGMVNKNATEGIYEVANAMGVFEGNAALGTLAQDDFRSSLAEGWLSADVMSKYLKIMSNEMTDAEWAALGLDEATETMLRNQAITAEESATKVRTFTQLVGALQEGVGSGWAKTIELLVGDFNQATELFSGIFDTLSGITDAQAASRNKMVQEFVDAGGRDDIIQGFKNIWAAAMAIITPIQKAFREIFPKKSGAELTKFSQGFLKLTEFVKMGAEAIGRMAPSIKLVLIPIKTLFSILGAVASVVVGFVAGIGVLISVMAKAGMGFAQMVANSDSVQRIFSALKDIFDTVVGSIRNFGNMIGEAAGQFQKAFADFGSGAYDKGLAAIVTALSMLGMPLEKAEALTTKFSMAWQHLSKEFAAFKKGGLEAVSLDRLTRELQKIGLPIGNIRGKLETLFGTLGRFQSIGKTAADAVERLRDAFMGLGGKMDLKNSINTGAVDDLTQKTERLRGVWEGFLKFIGGIGRFFGSVISSLGSFLITAIKKTTEYLKTLTFQELLALINTGFFIAMYAMISKFAKDLGGVAKSVSGALDTIGEAIEGFSKKETYADKILKIAIALGILAASAYVLSTVDPAALAKALAAIAVMLAELAIMMKVMSGMKFGEDSKIIKASIALGLMAVAILILSHAVDNFEGLSWEDMAKGLVGVATLLLALALFTKIADLNGSSSIKSSIGIVILAVAIKMLSDSVEELGTMDIDTLRQGLIVLGILMVALAGMTKVMNGAKLISASVGLLILSASLFALSLSLRYYATLDWATLIDGLSKVAVVLIGVGIAARALPSNLPVTAIGLALVAGAIVLLVPALAALGMLPIGVIVQGLLSLAVAMGIIAAAMWVMGAPGTLAGAAAMVIVVGALYLLVPLLITLGSLPWEVVLLGLGALAGVFIILGLAGLVLGPVVPVLIALAAVIALLGIAAMAVGAGMALFGLGFATMTAAIVAGGAVILGALQSLIMMIPLFAQQLALGIVAFAVVIRDAGPPIVAALTTVLISILQAIQNATPEAARTIGVMILAMVDTVAILVPRITQRVLEMVLEFLRILRQYAPSIVAEVMLLMLDMLQTAREYVPQIVDEALKLMTEFLAAVADNIGPIVDEATRLMVEFMDGIERNIPELVESGERMVRTFITEVGAALLGGVGDLIEDGKELAGGIISGMVTGITNGLESIKSAAREMAGNALSAAKRFLGMSSPSKEFMEVGRYSDEGMALGLTKYSGVVEKASRGVGHDAIFAMKKSISRIPELFDEDVSLNPIITPVLDLSEVQKGAQGIDPLLGGKSISVDANYNNARAADAQYRTNRITAEEISAQAREQAAKVEFNQYNTSPKALDRVEIYRQTNNQLSLMREEFNAASR